MICCNIKKFIITIMSLVAMIILSVTCVISAGAVDNSPKTDYLYGDANNDGAVNIKDCTYIQKCINNIVRPENYDYYGTVSDLNTDGVVNIKDVTILQKYLAEVYSSIPIKQEETTTTTPAPTTTPQITDDEGYNNHIYRP